MLAAAPALARPPPSTAGGLVWTEYNVYVSGGPRTWLGYTTTPTAPFTNGTVTPSDGTSGDTVNGASPRGTAENPTSAAFTHVFRGAAATTTRRTGKGRVDYRAR